MNKQVEYLKLHDNKEQDNSFLTLQSSALNVEIALGYSWATMRTCALIHIVNLKEKDKLAKFISIFKKSTN